MSLRELLSTERGYLRDGNLLILVQVFQVSNWCPNFAPPRNLQPRTSFLALFAACTSSPGIRLLLGVWCSASAFPAFDALLLWPGLQRLSLFRNINPSVGIRWFFRWPQVKMDAQRSLIAMQNSRVLHTRRVYIKLVSRVKVKIMQVFHKFLEMNNSRPEDSLIKSAWLGT